MVSTLAGTLVPVRPGEEVAFTVVVELHVMPAAAVATLIDVTDFAFVCRRIRKGGRPDFPHRSSLLSRRLQGLFSAEPK
jgi:hypothetical protein